MMRIARYVLYLRVSLVIFALFSIMSCFPQKNNNSADNLLSITVENSEIINHESINRQLLRVTSKLKETDNLYFILSKVWSVPNSHFSVISINKIKEDHLDVYAVTLIFDNIPDDDSISGYRYDIKLKNNVQRIWEITEVKKSWRCWQGRGHRYFSTTPCT